MTLLGSSLRAALRCRLRQKNTPSLREAHRPQETNPIDSKVTDCLNGGCGCGVQARETE